MKSRFANTFERAFTLIELMIVITLLIVVLGIAVPAFRGMLDSSERSLSENTLRVGVQIARDLASRGEGDAALVFLRDADGRTRLIPVISVGTYEDLTFNPAPFGPGSFSGSIPYKVTREVFAPVDLAAPLLLPRGYAVAGYADPNTIDQCFNDCLGSPTPIDFEGWYDSEAYGDEGSNSPTAESARFEGNWVLPETFQYEPAVQAPGGVDSEIGGGNVSRTPRQTFMIRFESSTGLLVRGARPSLMLDPRPSSLGRGVDVFPTEARWLRANRIDNPREWAARVVSTDDFVNPIGTIDGDDLYVQALAIGNYSNDTVLAGPVSRVALFRDADLAAGLGASGVNKLTRSLYLPVVDENADLVQEINFAGPIRFDMTLFEQGPASQVIREPGDVRIGINRWIQGDTNFIEAAGFDQSDVDGDDNVYGDAANGNLPADVPIAKIFIVQPNTGELTEVSR